MQSLKTMVLKATQHNEKSNGLTLNKEKKIVYTIELQLDFKSGAQQKDQQKISQPANSNSVMLLLLWSFFSFYFSYFSVT